jgi:hypothetical protein
MLPCCLEIRGSQELQHFALLRAETETLHVLKRGDGHFKQDALRLLLRGLDRFRSVPACRAGYQEGETQDAANQGDAAYRDLNFEVPSASG